MNAELSLSISLNKLSSELHDIKKELVVLNTLVATLLQPAEQPQQQVVKVRNYFDSDNSNVYSVIWLFDCIVYNIFVFC